MPCFVGVMFAGSWIRTGWLLEQERSFLWLGRPGSGLGTRLLYSIDCSWDVGGFELRALADFLVLRAGLLALAFLGLSSSRLNLEARGCADIRLEDLDTDRQPLPYNILNSKFNLN